MFDKIKDLWNNASNAYKGVALIAAGVGMVGTGNPVGVIGGLASIAAGTAYVVEPIKNFVNKVRGKEPSEREEKDGLDIEKSKRKTRSRTSISQQQNTEPLKKITTAFRSAEKEKQNEVIDNKINR